MDQNQAEDGKTGCSVSKLVDNTASLALPLLAVTTWATLAFFQAEPDSGPPFWYCCGILFLVLLLATPFFRLLAGSLEVVDALGQRSQDPDDETDDSSQDRPQLRRSRQTSPRSSRGWSLSSEAAMGAQDPNLTLDERMTDLKKSMAAARTSADRYGHDLASFESVDEAGILMCRAICQACGAEFWATERGVSVTATTRCNKE